MKNVNISYFKFKLFIAMILLGASSLSFGMDTFNDMVLEGYSINRFTNPNELQGTLKNIEMFIKNQDFQVNQIDSDGRTALHIFCKWYEKSIPEYLDHIKFLIRKGADVNKADSAGLTPLIKTCLDEHEQNKKTEIIQLLLESGADANKNSNDDNCALNNPLGIAINRINFETVKLLLKFGSYITNKSLELAIYHKKILELLHLVKDFDNSTNKNNFIDGHADNPEIHDLLTKRWLNSLESKNPFLTLNGKKILKEGLKSDVRIWTQE